MTLNNYLRQQARRVYDDCLFTNDCEFEHCHGKDKKARRKYERLCNKRDVQKEIESEVD